MKEYKGGDNFANLPSFFWHPRLRASRSGKKKEEIWTPQSGGRSALQGDPLNQPACGMCVIFNLTAAGILFHRHMLQSAPDFAKCHTPDIQPSPKHLPFPLPGAFFQYLRSQFRKTADRISSASGVARKRTKSRMLTLSTSKRPSNPKPSQIPNMSQTNLSEAN